MGDIFGPSFFIRPFQRYHVYRLRATILVFGVDKISREYSVLRIPVPRKDDVVADLELLDGEVRFPLRKLETSLNAMKTSESTFEKLADAYGLVGFISFLHGHYLILITKKSKVGKIGHHYVQSIEQTMVVPLFVEQYSRDEKWFLHQFDALNLSKCFYFSYTYELSRTAQQNLADAMREEIEQRRAIFIETDGSRHHHFLWNYHHMGPFLQREGWQHWCLSIIHGFFAYTKCSSSGLSCDLALIARRSRFFAGTRYRKRGLNSKGQVGNDVETEQLLWDDSTRHLSHGEMTSFVQVRGSVPVFWSQEATAINPKPPIVYPRCDPTLSATRFHFADLLERYGTPLVVVNLMRAKPVDSSEARLSKQYEFGIERVNRELSLPLRILYRHFDMKNHSKGIPIYEVFAHLSQSVVSRVGFFHKSRRLHGQPERMQSGVVRTNCVDCLDRTNVLQFFVGLEVLKQQLVALNLLPEPRLGVDSQVGAVLSELYDVMGDHLALQYAGSAAHKKFKLLGSRPRMMTSSKEFFTSINRHYHNSFTDSEKQASLNLFLGVYRPREHPRLWELDSDSWVHHQPLLDDYCPGEWWVEPLRKYDGKMRILANTDVTIPMHLGLEEQGTWFRTVHTVWKLTRFEKLLSGKWNTTAQINGSSHKLSTLLTFKALVQQKGPAQLFTASSVPAAELAFQVPHVVDASDMKVYRAYVDTRRLGRFLWLPVSMQGISPVLNLSLLTWTLSRSQPARTSLRELFREYKHLVDDTAFLYRFVCKYMALACAKRGKQSSPGSEGSEVHKHADTVPSSPHLSISSPRLPRVRICGYCDGPYTVWNHAAREEPVDNGPEKVGHASPESVAANPGDAKQSETEVLSQSLNLCPFHTARVMELQRFGSSGSLVVAQSSETPRLNRPRPLMIDIPPLESGRPLWKDWLQMRPRPWRQQPDYDAPLRQAADIRSDCGAQADSGSIGGSNDASGCSSPCTSTEWSKGDAQLRHLWTYAFPHDAPPAPEASELGVPKWWLCAVGEPTPQYSRTQQPDILGGRRKPPPPHSPNRKPRAFLSGVPLRRSALIPEPRRDSSLAARQSIFRNVSLREVFERQQGA